MNIQTIDNELVIKVPKGIDTIGLQRFLKYLEYKEATSYSKAKQKDVDLLVKSVKKGARKRYAAK
jgi:hypothetical protein